MSNLSDDLLEKQWFACMDISSGGWDYPFVMVGPNVRNLGGIISTGPNTDTFCLLGNTISAETDPTYEYCGGYGLIFSLIESPDPGTYYEISQEDKLKLLRTLKGYFAL